MTVYQTNAGLGYKEEAYLLKLYKTELADNYLIIDTHCSPDSGYEVGNVVELEDIYVEPSGYKIERSELYNTYLFNFWLQNYNHDR